jgi:hypothetical protein
METPQQEKVFYQDSNVTVTQSRFIARSKTYAMRNISSVSIFRIEKNRIFQIILIVIGVLMLFSDSSRVLGGIVAVIAALWLFTIKDEYSVRISTNAGEANSLTSKDQNYIQKIVDALNDAIIHRG